MDTAARGGVVTRASGNINHHSDGQDNDALPGMTKAAEDEEDLRTLESAVVLSKKLSWAQSWHTRWEVLTALVRMTEQAVLAQGSDTIPATVTTPIGLPVVARSLADIVDGSNTQAPRRFFFTSPEEPGCSDGNESDDDDEEDDEEEEDDYGEIVLNPRFGLQRSLTEERGLGHSFLHAQMLPVDTRSAATAPRFRS
jgi:hypothetical protein